MKLISLSFPTVVMVENWLFEKVYYWSGRVQPTNVKVLISRKAIAIQCLPFVWWVGEYMLST